MIRRRHNNLKGKRGESEVCARVVYYRTTISLDQVYLSIYLFLFGRKRKKCSMFCRHEFSTWHGEHSSDRTNAFEHETSFRSVGGRKEKIPPKWTSPSFGREEKRKKSVVNSSSWNRAVHVLVWWGRKKNSSVGLKEWHDTYIFGLTVQREHRFYYYFVIYNY